MKSKQLVAEKDIRCWKNFYIEDGKGFGPSHDYHAWGVLREGRTLKAKAARSDKACGKGVHAWRQRDNALMYPFGGTVCWLCIVPKGTFYVRSANKLRADRLVLVKEINKK